MADTTTFTVRAEPLTAEAFAPFGQVVQEGDMVMELRGDEVFHLNVLHYDRKPLRCDHLNRHHRATQMLVALAGIGPGVALMAGAVINSLRHELHETGEMPYGPEAEAKKPCGCEEESQP